MQKMHRNAKCEMQMREKERVGAERVRRNCSHKVEPVTPYLSEKDTAIAQLRRDQQQTAATRQQLGRWQSADRTTTGLTEN